MLLVEYIHEKTLDQALILGLPKPTFICRCAHIFGILFVVPDFFLCRQHTLKRIIKIAFCDPIWRLSPIVLRAKILICFFPLESSQWCDREDCAPTEVTDRQLSPNVVVCLHSYASTCFFRVASLEPNETEPNGYKLLKFVHKSRIAIVKTVHVYRKCM